MDRSPSPTLTRSGRHLGRKIVLLILLAPLPFAPTTPTFADEDVVPGWGTYHGEDPSLFVQALAPVTDGVVMTLGPFGDAESGREALVQFDTAGTLQWRAFYGGNLGAGTSRALASVPALGLIYLVGYTTYDEGVATPEAYQSRRECFGTGLCGQDGFVAQFDATGELRWGTYVGGPFNDYIYDASAEASGDLYICGETESATGLATPGAHQSALNGNVGGFVARFGVDGELQWATYVDGPCTTLAADPAGNGVVIAGWALAGGDFTTPGAFQPSPVGPNDGYLARFSADGQRRWSSYFGEGHALIHDLAVAATGAVYAVGATDSLDSLVTAGAHQEDYGGGESDLYIARFTPNGQREWATYFGGESFEREARAALDGAGNLYFSATTSSDDLATTGEPSSTINEQSDVILGKFRRDGTLEWAVYHGGERNEYAGALTVDSDDRIYLGGQTQSTTGIATPGVHQIEPRDYPSAFLVMLRAS